MAFAAFLLALAVPTAHGASAAAATSAGATRQVQRIEPLIFRGTTAPTKLSEARAAVVAFPGREVRRQQRGFRALDVHPAARLRSQAFGASAIPIPVAPNLPVVPATPDFFGFLGLTHTDQRNAGTGIYTNSQFSLEPPDQGLCAGNGFVMEPINNALAVYSSFGTRLTAPTPMNQFFGLSPEFIRTTPPVFGQSLSDPRCYFDRDTKRWFVTEFEEDIDPPSGNPTGNSSVLIAVSQSADPTGAYNIFAINTTDAGNPNCPCFPDQPLIGADAHGFYLSTNEFPIFVDGFNGAQIYALSKTGLTTGTLKSIVHIDAGALPTPDGQGATWYSIQPSATPNTAAQAATLNGTEYFLSSLDFFGAGDNRIAVWAVTNTRSLSKAVPSVGFQHILLGSEAYDLLPPFAATQKAGPFPLGTSLGDPLPLISANDDRMNQVVFSGGRLWSGVNTSVRSGKNLDVGIAFFSVAPGFNSSNFLTAHMVQQGYVAVAGQNMIFPSIGVNASGRAVMAATLTGPSYFPTAVYVTQDGKVHVAGKGVLPDDGFTAYPQEAGPGANGIGRWGDYSAAVADTDGSIWVASEFIPDGPRTLLANWGTFIGHVQPH